MDETFPRQGLIVRLKQLKRDQSIALALWCMDRALNIFKAVSLKSNFQSDRIPVFITYSEELWHKSSEHHNRFLLDFCNHFNIEAIKIKEVDKKMLTRLFCECDLVTHDHIANSILDSVAIVASILRLLDNAEHQPYLTAILKSYYDIYFQPTFDLLTGEYEITQDVYNRAFEHLEVTNPLMSALHLLESQVSFLKALGNIDFADSRLRGTH